MATITIRMTAVCTGGDHATVSLVKSGQTRVAHLNTSELREAVTSDEIEAFSKIAIRLMNEGKTGAQFRAALSAGFEVTV